MAFERHAQFHPFRRERILEQPTHRGGPLQRDEVVLEQLGPRYRLPAGERRIRGNYRDEAVDEETFEGERVGVWLESETHLDAAGLDHLHDLLLDDVVNGHLDVR